MKWALCAFFVLCCAAIPLAATAQGGHIAVRIHLTTYTLARKPKRQATYILRCEPTGGTLPLAARICRDIARHPRAMLDPDRPRTDCSGSPSMPDVAVDRWNGGWRLVGEGSPGCGWPGTAMLDIYYDAITRDLQALARDEKILHCDEDPVLLRKPTPWRKVTACLNRR